MESFKLFVYKDERYRWVFDDSEFNLSQEAFVSGWMKS
jgi:hypothetical protein